MTVRGQIVAGNGWPLSPATVTVVGADGRQAGRGAVDAEGRFAVPVSGAGAATVIVAAPGHAPLARTAVLGPAGADLGLLTLTRPGDSAGPRAGRWVVDPDHSSITVTAQHLGLSRIRGQFRGFGGEIVVAEPTERSWTEARIEAASIDTGNAMRDDHLRSADFLDVERFPQIVYRSTGIRPVGPRRWTVDGALELVGLVRDVPLELTYGGTGPDPWGGRRVAFTATARLDRADFRMNWNQAFDVGIALVGTHLGVELDIQAVLAA
ncbi:MAG TPA: YceI family protein [Mycobacteriales bacterium]|jgi:polyisoprenoid-binding protein YceI